MDGTACVVIGADSEGFGVSYMRTIRLRLIPTRRCSLSFVSGVLRNSTEGVVVALSWRRWGHRFGPLSLHRTLLAPNGTYWLDDPYLQERQSSLSWRAVAALALLSNIRGILNDSWSLDPRG